MGNLAFEVTGAQPGCPPFLRIIMEGVGQRLWCPGGPGARGYFGSSLALPLRGVSSVNKEVTSQSEAISPDDGVTASRSVVKMLRLIHPGNICQALNLSLA